jgi:hypothetical protein
LHKPDHRFGWVPLARDDASAERTLLAACVIIAVIGLEIAGRSSASGRRDIRDRRQWQGPIGQDESALILLRAQHYLPQRTNAPARA